MTGHNILGPWETSAGPWDNMSDRVAWAVCMPGGGDVIAEIDDVPEAEAYANLMAAAPDMLAALELAAAQLSHYEPVAPVIRAAIAKAKGEAR